MNINTLKWVSISDGKYVLGYYGEEYTSETIVVSLEKVEEGYKVSANRIYNYLLDDNDTVINKKLDEIKVQIQDNFNTNIKEFYKLWIED